MKTTKVKFLYNEREDDLFAYFPDFNYDDKGFLKESYSHIGQHSACHPSYAEESIAAEPYQYESLKKELESIGYNLVIE